ncbi:hypothetical protein SAMN05216330_12142 [Bradyrhizobium sp. Ghvi]|nr:hypothetical protein SAMN05216330_12142 [Bradyrhizobium sp. Ghvi]
MISEGFGTCAAAQAWSSRERSPEQIADSAIEEVGAAMVSIHVPDLQPAQGSQRPALYRAVAGRTWKFDINWVINLSAAVGGASTLVVAESRSHLESRPRGIDGRVPVGPRVARRGRRAHLRKRVGNPAQYHFSALVRLCGI